MNIIIFDTTLRDGEQSPGASMTKEEKLLIADALDKMGVDVIEAGFAIASQGDFECIKAVSQQAKNAIVCSLARTKEKDIELAAEAIKPAKRGRIHTFIATSPIHMQYKLKMQPDAVLNTVQRTIRFARKFTDDIEWSAEDATRSDIDFLCRCVEAAIESGATTVNIPDTVGYITPDEYAEIITTIKNKVPNIDKAVISVHCHNDLGLAVANSLSAVNAGAGQVECTINGLGERAGNAALEEIVMAFKVRHDKLPFKTNINTTHISRVSKLVSTITGFSVQKNKAIVGANAFAHEAGIHVHGILKSRLTYEIMRPEWIGLQKSELVLGKHSGRAAFKNKLGKLGITINEDQFEAAFEHFKALADKKKHIMNADIISIVDDELIQERAKLVLQSYHISGLSDLEKTATIVVKLNGEDKIARGKGDGPLDAIFNAINSVVNMELSLEQYDVHGVTRGTDALAEASVVLNYKGKNFASTGHNTDTVFASAKAYVNAINKILNYEENK